jgi:hypothetical protein
VLLHIGVSKVKIATLGAMESHLSLLCLEVDVAFVTYNGLSLVQGLSVDGDGSSLGVVALRNPLSKLVISSLGSASEHAGLDGEIFVAICVTHKLAVLRLHNFTADSVLVEGHLD